MPGTIAEDGDPFDVMVFLEESTFPGCRIRVRAVGVIVKTAEKGTDASIPAVPDEDPRYDGIRDIVDVPRHRLYEIENFFATYKKLEKGREMTIRGWGIVSGKPGKYWAAAGNGVLRMKVSK